MPVGRREGRQKREGLVARSATATPNRNPIMLFIVRLFAAAAVADDGILRANWAAAQKDFRAGLGPVSLEVVLRGGKWDKQNRGTWGSAPGDLAKIAPGVGPSPPGNRINWKRITLFAYRRWVCNSEDWPVKRDMPALRFALHLIHDG
jgi:hypothetical protein